MSEGYESILRSLYEREAERLKQLPPNPCGAYLQPVFGSGPVGARLMLVGEAPGAQETEQGRPFVGKAGRQLDELLSAVSLPRSALFITNAVKYRPYKIHPLRSSFSNRSPTRTEIRACAPLLMAEIAYIKPRVVATLGNTPLLAITGRAAVGELHGKAVDCGGFTLFPLYHPASVIYNRALASVLEADMAALAELVARK